MVRHIKLLICLIFSLFLIAIFSGNVLASDKKEVKTDTTGQKITRIKVGDKGIIIKTQEGKELEEKPGEMILDEEGFIISPEAKETTFTQIKIKTGEHATTIMLEQGDIVEFGKDVTVDQGEKVTGDVVAIWGDVRINGIVEGSAVSIGGDVFLSSTAVIETDAVSVGGNVIREPGAIIKGQRVGLSFFPRHISRTMAGPHLFRGTGFLFFFSLLVFMFLFFLEMVVLALFPTNVQKIKDGISRNMWKSSLIGFTSIILTPLALLLLLVTIVGILGIPIAILFIFLAMMFGFTSVSLIVGEKLKDKTNLKPQNQMMTLGLGTLAVAFIFLFSCFMGIFSGLFSLFSLVFIILGFLVIFAVFTIGFGGAVQTLLGTRPKDKPIPAAPAQTPPKS